jgi:hypothetical protein
MTREKISAIVDEALDSLVAEHPDLLDLDVTERALSHHLAIYIMRLVPPEYEYDVDVEYNRHGIIPKRLTLKSRRASDREKRATSVFPDIIVHKRNSDDNNLLVLEMKKPGEPLAYDQEKLEAFREELGYQYAAHVIIGRVNGTTVRDLIWI